MTNDQPKDLPSALPGDQLAGAVYVVAIEEQIDATTTRSRAFRFVKSVFGAISLAVAGLFAPDSPISTVGDLVVRRRDDAQEVVRESAGPPEEAAASLEYVQHQLADLSVSAFEEAWSIGEDPAGKDSGAAGQKAQ